MVKYFYNQTHTSHSSTFVELLNAQQVGEGGGGWGGGATAPPPYFSHFFFRI